MAAIDRAEVYERAFVDLTAEITKRVRGNDVLVPAAEEVNKDEKRNLCQWLCETGTAEDFVNFEQIFRVLEELLTPTTVRHGQLISGISTVRIGNNSMTHQINGATFNHDPFNWTDKFSVAYQCLSKRFA